MEIGCGVLLPAFRGVTLNDTSFSYGCFSYSGSIELLLQEGLLSAFSGVPLTYSQLNIEMASGH